MIARPPRTCRNVAMDLLARREHSRRELATKLRQRDFPQDEIDVVLTRLEQEGLQSDARFAEAWVRQRAGRGYGPLRIRQELRERGIDDALATTALARWAGEWRAVAVRQHDKHFGRQPRDMRERARQQRHLQSRGFGFDIIKEVISE